MNRFLDTFKIKLGEERMSAMLVGLMGIAIIGGW
jgi:hypothetical protein